MGMKLGPFALKQVHNIPPTGFCRLYTQERSGRVLLMHLNLFLRTNVDAICIGLQSKKVYIGLPLHNEKVPIQF